MTLNVTFMRETFLSTLAGVPTTLELTLVALLISFPLGFFMALGKQSQRKLTRRCIAFYVSFIRGTPIVLQILFMYSLLPSLLNVIIKNVLHLPFNVFDIDPILYAFIVFSLNTTAVLSEAFRSALLTVNHGQMEAALSVGLSRAQAYMRIIIPQALVAAMPNICNTTVNLLKSTSLAYMMTVKDITAIAKLNAAKGYNYIEAYIVIFFIYIILCTIVQLVFQGIEKALSTYKQRVIA